MNAADLDAADSLAAFRKRFVIDDPELIYLDGNSLGRLPVETIGNIESTVRREWGDRLIRSWNEQWVDLPRRLGAKLAALLGARPHEVIIADSTSVNLFKLALAALLARPGRSRILTDDLNFPSDLYVLRSAGRLAGGEKTVEVISSEDGITTPVDRIAEGIDRETALVSLSHTTFKSGSVYPMQEITSLAHSVGALTLWDLSHSVGSVPVDLNSAGADLAVGCTYKHLHGGPGSPAFLYVREDLQEQLDNPIHGWFAHRGPFDFSLEFQPAPGIQRFTTGTPPVLSLRAAEAGIDLVAEAGIEAIREKSILQTEFMIYLWERDLQELGYRLQSPRAAQQRGSHISLGHSHGLPIDRALIDLDVIPDFRHPDNIRLGFSPLYTRFEEINRASELMARVVREGLYRSYSSCINNVT